MAICIRAISVLPVREVVAITNVNEHGTPTWKAAVSKAITQCRTTLNSVDSYRFPVNSNGRSRCIPQKDKIEAMEKSGNRGRQIALAYAASVGVWVSIAL